MKQSSHLTARGILLITLCFTGALLSACCSTKHVADPKDITLKSALVSVIDGLNAMREASTNQPFGLYPSDVEVTFKVSASQDNSGELKLDLSVPVVSGVGGTAGGSARSQSLASRGNEITVRFSNVLLADPNSTLVGRAGTNVIQLLEQLHTNGSVMLRGK